MGGRMSFPLAGASQGRAKRHADFHVPLHPLLSAVPFRSREFKLPPTMGRWNQCEICLEPRTPSRLPRCPGQLPCGPSGPGQVQVQRRGQAGLVLSRMRRARRNFSPPGLRGTVLVLPSFPWSLLFCSHVLYNGMFRFKTLHGSFRDWWSSFYFSKIKVIQTSCTCRLKRCNPLALCERSTRSMSMGSPWITHLKVYEYWG